MAEVYSGTSNYDGSADSPDFPAVGTGVIRVALNASIDGYGRLKVMVRPADSTSSYVPKRFPDGRPFIDSSDIFKFDATGVQYYYDWELDERKIASGTEVTVTITEF